jgi:uncharacterized membrane protein
MSVRDAAADTIACPPLATPRVPAALVNARYTADARRGRVYAVRYFLGPRSLDDRAVL